MYQEDPVDQFCRITLAWMIYIERTISIEAWLLRKTVEIEAWHIWKLSLIRCRSSVRRLCTRLYYGVIASVLMSIGLKHIPTWTELEEETKQIEALIGETIPRTPAHAEGLKREQAKKE